MFASAFNFVDQRDAIRGSLEIGFDLDVEKSLFLKIVDQILLSFLHQVAINGSLGKHGNQRLEPSACEERNAGDLRSGCANGDSGSYGNRKRHVHTILLGNVLRRVFSNRAGKMVLLCERTLQERGRCFDAIGRVRLARLQKRTAQAGTQRT